MDKSPKRSQATAERTVCQQLPIMSLAGGQSSLSTDGILPCRCMEQIILPSIILPFRPAQKIINRIIDGRMMKSNQAGTTKNTKEVSSLFAICAFFAAIPPSRVRELVRAFGRRLVAVEGSWAVRLFPHTAERGPALATSRQSV